MSSVSLQAKWPSCNLLALHPSSRPHSFLSTDPLKTLLQFQLLQVFQAMSDAGKWKVHQDSKPKIFLTFSFPLSMFAIIDIYSSNYSQCFNETNTYFLSSIISSLSYFSFSYTYSAQTLRCLLFLPHCAL